MTDLEELIERRNALNNKIREIQSQSVQCGRARLNIQTTSRKTWRVMINLPYIYDKRKSSWFSVIEEWERDDVIKQIPALIKDLMGLYNLLKEGVVDGEFQTER